MKILKAIFVFIGTLIIVPVILGYVVGFNMIMLTGGSDGLLLLIPLTLFAAIYVAYQTYKA